MSQTSENERVEQIWSGWSKFGTGGAAEQCGEQLTIWRRRCCIIFYFHGRNFYNVILIICWFSCEIYIIGRAKRAPHWGVQSRFRVIYIYIYIYVVGMSVVCQINCVGGIT